jgi:hypothetical protein
MRQRWFVRANEMDLDLESIKLRSLCNCGARRVPTPSGVCCPKGCGKIQPMPRAAAAAVALAFLPVAKRQGNTLDFTIAGKDGIWRRTRLAPDRPTTRGIDPETRPAAGQAVARVLCRNLWRAFLFTKHDIAPAADSSTKARRSGAARSAKTRSSR